jgi:hypothetical protein
MSQLNDEYNCYCIEPPSPPNVCEEIVGNSATNEPTLIEICKKLLNANLNQGRTNQSIGFLALKLDE